MPFNEPRSLAGIPDEIRIDLERIPMEDHATELRRIRREKKQANEVARIVAIVKKNAARKRSQQV